MSDLAEIWMLYFSYYTVHRQGMQSILAGVGLGGAPSPLFLQKPGAWLCLGTQAQLLFF